TPLIGGIPIVIDGQVVGGIGVSGAASANQDEELALAGAAAFSVAGRGESGGHEGAEHSGYSRPGLHSLNRCRNQIIFDAFTGKPFSNERPRRILWRDLDILKT